MNINPINSIGMNFKANYDLDYLVHHRETSTFRDDELFDKRDTVEISKPEVYNDELLDTELMDRDFEVRFEKELEEEPKEEVVRTTVPRRKARCPQHSGTSKGAKFIASFTAGCATLTAGCATLTAALIKKAPKGLAKLK